MHLLGGHEGGRQLLTRHRRDELAGGVGEALRGGALVREAIGGGDRIDEEHQQHLSSRERE